MLLERIVELGRSPLIEAYHFEVLKGEEVIAAEAPVQLSNSKAAWPKIAKIAKRIKSPGCRIRVRDQSGETIILVGVTAALRYADFDFAA